MSLVCPGGILGSPLTTSILLTGAAPKVSLMMEFPLPAHTPELEYLNLALFVSLFVSLSVSRSVPTLLLFLTLPQILSLLLSLPTPPPLRLQSLYLKTLTQTLIQVQT